MNVLAPNGEVECEYTGKQLGLHDFYCSTTSGLSNGDAITISIRNEDMEYYAKKIGMIPATIVKFAMAVVLLHNMVYFPLRDFVEVLNKM